MQPVAGEPRICSTTPAATRTAPSAMTLAIHRRVAVDDGRSRRALARSSWLVVVAVLLLRGRGRHAYKLLFQNAGQLVKDNDVQVGGRRDRLGARASS